MLLAPDTERDRYDSALMRLTRMERELSKACDSLDGTGMDARPIIALQGAINSARAAILSRKRERGG